VAQAHDSTVFGSAPVTFDLKLFLEVVLDPEAVTFVATSAATRTGYVGLEAVLLAPPFVPVSHILLIFKLHDPLAETLHLIGHLLLDQESCMLDNKHAVMKLAAGSEMALYEEIINEPTIHCEKVEWHNPLEGISELRNGDIIMHPACDSTL